MACGVFGLAYTADELRQVYSWRQQGVEIAEVARRLGRTTAGIQNLCRRRGWVEHPRAREAREVVRMIPPGVTVKDYAARVGLTVHQLHRARRSLGLKFSPEELTRVRRAVGRRTARDVARRHGCDHMGHVSAKVGRLKAMAQGWPAGASRQDARYLAALYDETDLVSGRAVAGKLGYSWRAGHGHSSAVTCRLSALRKEGWLVAEYRVCDSGRGWGLFWGLTEEVRRGRLMAILREQDREAW